VATLTFDGIGKVYPGGMRAVDDLNLFLDDGEFMVLIGPSGCGKTTALRMVAGLEEISEGELRVDDAVVNSLDARRRDVAMVFQNYAIYPHMTIFENIAFPLRSQRIAKSEVTARVNRVAGLLGLEELLPRKPRTLSGGQRQRVAMGRAFVRRPRVFLMDEPLSNLDAKLRVQMRAEIAQLQRELGVTTLYVTHDQVEAMTMGTRVAVMRKGELQQVGEPQHVYDRPKNLFVATFIGSPAMNLVTGHIQDAGDGLRVRIGEQTLALPERLVAQRPALGRYRDGDVAIGIRPEHLSDAALDRTAGAQLEAEVTLVETLGSERLVHLELPGEPVLTDEIVEIRKDTDASVLTPVGRIGRDPEASTTSTVAMVARVDIASQLQRGARSAIGVKTDHLHFFDLATGEAIAD
jgi:multiple sugar transport system ATP-binding protein